MALVMILFALIFAMGVAILVCRWQLADRSSARYVHHMPADGKRAQSEAKFRPVR